MWDVGGGDKIRLLWRHYYEDLHTIIFVVDSNDRDRIAEAKEEIHKLLADPEIQHAKMLIFANK